MAMLAATPTNLSTAITNVINTAPYNMDSFISGLLTNLNPTTAGAVAAGLNANPDFVDYLVRNLDGAQAAQQLNKNEAWTTALVQNLNADSIGGALNTALASAGGKAFLTNLLNTMDSSVIGRALQNNQQLTRDLLTAAGNIGLGTTLKPLLLDAATKWPATVQTIPLTSTDPEAIARWKPLGFLSDLFTNLDAEMVSNAYNNSLTYAGRADLPYTAPDGQKYTMLQVLWLKVQSVMELVPIMEIPMWIHIDSMVAPIN